MLWSGRWSLDRNILVARWLTIVYLSRVWFGVRALELASNFRAMVVPSLWKRHAIAFVFAALILVHWVGVFSVTGDRYIFAVNLFAASIVLVYVFAALAFRDGFDRLAVLLSRISVNVREQTGLLLTMDFFVILFPVAYFIAAGYIPVVKMYFTADYMLASKLRYEFFASLPAWLRYAGEYYIKGIVPLWLIFSYVDRRKLFPAVFIAAAAFSFAIVNKSYIIIVFAPLMIFWLFKRRWIAAALLFGFIGALLVLSVIVQQKSTLLAGPASESYSDTLPASKELTAPSPSKADDADFKELSIAFAWKPIEAIWVRSFSAIGAIEAQWLETYPSDVPFERGCGYSWASKVVGCEFVNTANKIWKKYYPDLDARGLNGTVTAADYVQAYANFGLVGIVGSAFAIGIILVLLNAVFPDPAIRVALNLVPLMLTFESVLTTLLNSSGWGLTIALGAVLFAAPPSQA